MQLAGTRLEFLIDSKALRGLIDRAQKSYIKREEQTGTSRITAGIGKETLFLAVLFEGQMVE